MARSNTVSPGLGSVGTISHQHKAGRINTHSSETSGATGNPGRPGVKFSVVS